VALVELLAEEARDPLDAESKNALVTAVRALAPEPFALEAVSKVLALLVPDAVPLMPAPALAFLLGGDAPYDTEAFVTVVAWFARAVKEAEEPLARWAQAHAEVPLSAAQVLDRLLWFDSEGHRHWKGQT
jgi:hypothetical protein